MNYLLPVIVIAVLLLAGGGTAYGEDALPREPAWGLGTAAGVSLAEVVSMEEVDSRPSDGNLAIVVKLRNILATGTVGAGLEITKEYGGLRPPELPEPKPGDDPLFPVPFNQGKRYWFVWASPHEWVQYPHGLIDWWPEEAPGVESLREVVAKDHFARKPHREPTTGITYDRRLDPDGETRRVRGTLGRKVLWDIALEGEPEENVYQAWAVYPKDAVADLAHVRAVPTEIFLSVATTISLREGNEYGVPADKYALSTWYELTSGRRAMVEVYTSPRAGAQWLARTYDLATGKPVWERESRWLKSGGLAAGAREEGWLRHVVRTFDPMTGKALSEETFWVDGSKPVKVETKQ